MKMLLPTGIINIRGHCARKKFYVIQPITRVDSDLSLTIRCEERGHRCCGSPRKVIAKAVIKEKTSNPMEKDL